MPFQKGNKDGKPFEKGDKRINRKGRPKTHDKLRELIQKLAWEESETKPEWTRLELLLRAMLTSKSATDRENILRHGWGDVPKELIISGKDVDAAIRTELDRVAGRSEAEDAGAPAGDANAASRPADPGTTGGVAD